MLQRLEMRNTRNKIIIAVVLTLTASILLLTYKNILGDKSASLLSDPSSSQHIVTLTKDGFEPDEIIIRQNDRVSFKTTRKESFWPASNVHPQHSIYPKFDPKTPISSDMEWSFKFVDAGRFSYHDHIFANHTGKIIVVAPEADPLKKLEVNSDDCSALLENSQKQQCRDEQLVRVLDTQGLDAAFDYFIALYKTDPEVPKECHGWGHSLGKAGYKLYSNGEDVPLRPEASYCGYGYFHGFIGELIKHTGDVTQTLKFCEYVVRELEDALSSIDQSCVHGVGHGIASMLVEEPENWGELEQVIEGGLSLCEKVYSKEGDLENCYDGVFNESHLDLFNSKYGMNFEEFMKHGDPFWYCQKQEERHKQSCYYEFSGMFWKIFNRDIVAITKYVLDNVENLQERGAKVIAKVAADRIQDSIVNDTHEDSVQACSIVPQFLYESCFRGVLNGFIQHGEPGNLHPKGYAFCGEPSLSKAEQDDCHKTFTYMLQGTYTKEQMKTACEYIQNLREVEACTEVLNS